MKHMLKSSNEIAIQKVCRRKHFCILRNVKAMLRRNMCGMAFQERMNGILFYCRFFSFSFTALLNSSRPMTKSTEIVATPTFILPVN